MDGMRTAEFTDAGVIDGIPLVQHRCPAYRPGGVVYVSPSPSQPGDEYLVPGCGCRPAGIR
jgi:hypothetical protein